MLHYIFWQCIFHIALLILSWAFLSVVIPRPRRNPPLPRTAGSHSWRSTSGPPLCSGRSCIVAINSPRSYTHQHSRFPGRICKPGWRRIWWGGQGRPASASQAEDQKYKPMCAVWRPVFPRLFGPVNAVLNGAGSRSGHVLRLGKSAVAQRKGLAASFLF